jgi:hypothetical protein
MARVTLEEPDREGAVLPDVCMKCGLPAPDRVFMDFPPLPPRWLYPFFVLSPLALAAIARRTRMSFHVPLCEIHKKSVFGRFRMLTWAMVCLFILGVVGLVLASDIRRGEWVPQPWGPDGKEVRVFVKHGPPPEVGGVLTLIAAIGIALCAAVIVVLHRFHRLRAARVTDFTITFDRVAPAFVRAYEESRIPVPLPADGVTTHWQPSADAAPPQPPSNIRRET